ncbi:unnamed protein product [Chrysodeixis includens]|uniref:YqaJ viral recombinase domain-containing protein n=1 Tax=Chrysodeixis includens TaxID=689277 RepID=A0A9P0BWC5_CHRIL|nr:unnamed protein product [Chrysodeixis includens]
MSDTFVKADSRNLPKVETVMILEYISTSSHHSIAEIRGAKILMSSRDSYVDTAVGYVKVGRTGSKCTVTAKIVPEHRISKKLYTVTCNIDEHNDVIIDSVCEDCAASGGGCKHSLLLLFWLAKKSSEPSSTAVECYWNKPTLSSASTEAITSKEIFRQAKVPKLMPKDKNILTEFEEECKRRNLGNSLILKFSEGHKTDSKNIFDIMLQFIDVETIHTYSNFRDYLKKVIDDESILNINAKSLGQSESKYWHSIRQGRLTASKLYEAAHCKTDGTLVEHILGGYKVPETKSILRGRKLEKHVLKVIEDKLHVKIKQSGFMLINGILGASPDGVGEDFVVEIKCPASEKTVKSYIQNDIVNNKYKTQILCQMLACKKSKGLFCVADPLFETTKNIHLVWVDFDEVYINEIINKAEAFWSLYVFPKLLESVKK